MASSTMSVYVTSLFGQKGTRVLMNADTTTSYATARPGSYRRAV
jgi:hypothetical protein